MVLLDFTAEQTAAIEEDIYSYKTDTNITAKDDLTIVDVKYLRDAETYINNKIKEALS